MKTTRFNPTNKKAALGGPLRSPGGNGFCLGFIWQGFVFRRHDLQAGLRLVDMIKRPHDGLVVTSSPSDLTGVIGLG